MSKTKYYLDEEIVASFTGLTSNTYYKYRVSIYDYNSATYKVVFNGSAFSVSGTVNIDVTDILSNYKCSYDFRKAFTNSSCILNGPIGKVKVELLGTTTVTKEMDIVFAFRYVNGEDSEWLDNYDNDNITTITVTPLLSGTVAKGSNTFRHYESKLTPKIPYIKTTNFGFPFIYYVNGYTIENTDCELKYYIDDQEKAATEMERGNNVCVLPLSLLFNNHTGSTEALYVNIPEWVNVTVAGYCIEARGVYGEEDECVTFLVNRCGWVESEAYDAYAQIKEGQTVVIYQNESEEAVQAIYVSASGYFDASVEEVEVEGSALSKIADIEYCKSKHYLMWQDRMGGIQCQPFEQTDKYTEDVSTIKVQSFKGRDKKVNWKVTSKWQLNTGWLDEDTYRFYESIFVSPFLKLYDVELDKSFDVLVTDTSYTEKTYKNQGKKLINLTINLQADKIQNIYN